MLYPFYVQKVCFGDLKQILYTTWPFDAFFDDFWHEIDIKYNSYACSKIRGWCKILPIIMLYPFNVYNFLAILSTYHTLHGRFCLFLLFLAWIWDKLSHKLQERFQTMQVTHFHHLNTQILLNPSKGVLLRLRTSKIILTQMNG